MLRASLFRLPVVVAFSNAAVLGMVLALLSYYYYSVPGVNSSLASYDQHKHNASSRIASELWHSHNAKESEALVLKKAVRVLCFITVDTPSIFGVAFGDTIQQDTWTAIQTIIDTWGKRCSQMIMFGNVPDMKVDSIPFLAVKSNDVSSWKALALMFTQVSTLFDMKFDWFLKVDINTFVVMENLRYFVSLYDPSLPFYFGHAVSSTWGMSYNSANAGILLSRGALMQLQKALTKGVCTVHGGGNSDIELGNCLAKTSIHPQDTRDADGHARFLPFDPQTHLLGKGSSWFAFLRTKSKYPIKEGPECCSDYAVAFHNIPAEMMTVMEFFIYHLDAFGLSTVSSKLVSLSPQRV